MNTEIRRLSKKEKHLVDEILHYASGNELEEFQVGRMLFNETRFLGICCDPQTKTVSVYKDDHANAHETYSKVMCFCDFLKELKEHGYIGIDTIVNEKRDTNPTNQDCFWIYNRDTHSVEHNILLTKNEEFQYAPKEGSPIERFHSEELFVSLRDYVYHKVIYPKPALKELKENKYLSIEEKRHRRNELLQWIAIGCAIVFPFINSWYISNRGTEIHSTDLQSIDNRMGVIQSLLENPIQPVAVDTATTGIDLENESIAGN